MVNNAFCTCTEKHISVYFLQIYIQIYTLYRESMVSVLTINELLKLEIKIK